MQSSVSLLVVCVDGLPGGVTATRLEGTYGYSINLFRYRNYRFRRIVALAFC